MNNQPIVFLTMWNIYIQVNMSVAIVAMVNNTGLASIEYHNNNETHSQFACDVADFGNKTTQAC